VNTNLSFSDLIILIGAVQGIFLSIVLWNLKSGNRISHRWLAFFLFLFALSMTGFVLWDSKMILQAHHLSMIVAPAEILLGPVFFFYILSLTRKNFSFRKIDYLHFIPFIITIAYFVPFYFESPEEKIQFNLRSYDQLPPLWQRFSAFSTFYNIIYMLLAMLLIERHRRTIKRYYSAIDKINLRWIQMLFAFVVIGFVCCVLLGIVGFRFGNNFSNIVFSVCIYAFGYYGMKQKEIFSDFREEVKTDEPEPVVIKAEAVAQRKYEKSGLSEEKATQLLSQLENVMTVEKLFLDPELNLQQLSDKLSVSIHHVSQVLNQYKQQNFFDYVNQLRIEEFKKQLLNPDKQHLSLLGLAFECGFNSKAAFNAVFKKQTGTTPSAYRNSLKAEIA